MLFQPTNKLGQLEFLAFGQASDSEKGWLGLYDDSTWEFGNSYREINSNGTYFIKGDTVFLTATIGTAEPFEKAFIIANSQKINSSKSELNGDSELN